jgi:glycosyltransferase involved in cell wall biosynthesis
VDALSAALAAGGLPLRVVCPANHQARQAMGANPNIEILVCRNRGITKNVSRAGKVWENARFIGSSCKTLLRALQPGDIVHLQYILHLPFGLAFFWCARIGRAHIVFTVHDPLPHKFLLPMLLRRIEMTSLRWAYDWSDALITHSEAGKEELVQKFGISPEKIHVIVHGPYVLKEKVRPCSDAGRLEVLFFGSLRENKAPHLAIEAVQKLASEGVAIRLTIAGQVVNRKEEGYWASCQTLLDPLDDSIRLKEGFVPDGDVAQVLSDCHCLVLPYTSFSSDSGVAYMALANRKAIVATGAGGLGWLLDQSHGGIRITQATAEGVAEALRHAIRLGPALLEQMGETGADWVLAECGWGRVARETRELYSKFIPQFDPALRSPEAIGERIACESVP